MQDDGYGDPVVVVIQKGKSHSHAEGIGHLDRIAMIYSEKDGRKDGSRHETELLSKEVEKKDTEKEFLKDRSGNHKQKHRSPGLNGIKRRGCVFIIIRKDVRKRGGTDQEIEQNPQSRPYGDID